MNSTVKNSLVKTLLAVVNRIRRARLPAPAQTPYVKEKSMSDARVETIINYYELAEGLVSSGQPSAAEFAAIHDAGYQVIINLVPADASMALADEPQIVESLGMEYIHIPVIWNEPTAANLDAYFDAMQKNQAKKVYTHCEVNYRASSFLYLYRRKFLGVDEKQARQDLQWIWAPNPTWTKFIEDMANRP